MEVKDKTYEAPQVETIEIEIEQAVLQSSGEGTGEGGELGPF